LKFIGISNFILNAKIGKDIYKTQDNELTKAGMDIIRQVGGIGSIAFTLAVLIIALVIIFASISPKKVGVVWMAFFSCLAGALLFFGAYLFAPAIAKIF